MSKGTKRSHRAVFAIAVGAAVAAVGLGVGTAGAQDVSATPTYRTLSLRTGFAPDPQSVSLRAGGSDRVRIPGCAGFINSRAPDVDVNFAAGSLPLNFYVRSSADTTLVVNLPDGTWVCNDDAHGTDPLVSLRSPQSGNYNVWVGNYASASTLPATLYVSELAPRW